MLYRKEEADLSYPANVKIVEVGPRDGLQNEAQIVSAGVKVELIDRLADCGLSFIEAGAFVSPRWVPQMADSAEVLAAIRRKPNVSYPVLVPNIKGLERAIAAGVEEIAVFGAASESFTQKNINCSIAESLERFLPVMAEARAQGLRVRGYVSCVLGCPYEGEVAVSAVSDVAEALYHGGCYEISLGDTIGVGTPAKARAMVNAVAERVPVGDLALHFHDTYGQALANIHACLELGVGTVDSSLAGLGGCPYADGASGNVASEDVLYMLEGLGVKTGIDLALLIETSWWISEQLGRRPASKVALARGGKTEKAS
ncbi:hydroxymethylglutaryl-CoA lyase [Pelagibius sp. Alg239-R121]|uniref:hydroxymethylglutaryl-CoA lyase n=1 Tax=Pelagibius sp. Alg239-R121 TaxID=2993448 RepID=UPI0024A6D3E0|nr:hydroxymethylglutaryl-CoA lyase [Pelagibius sp. Alg239-R121]